jgi:hypothetical protein
VYHLIPNGSLELVYHLIANELVFWIVLMKSFIETL